MYFKDGIINKMVEDVEVVLGKISVENLMCIIIEFVDGYFCLFFDVYNEVFDGILIGEV